MITKWIQFTVEAASIAEFQAELSSLQAASNTESGCLQYLTFQDLDLSNIFTVLEIWEDPPAFEAHRISIHVQSFKTRCEKMITEKSGQSLRPV